MHWIEKYRQFLGMDREQFSRCVPCSELLIFMLENGNKEITHPKLANRIAAICGATAEQRDSIVHKKHRGTWTPEKQPVNLGKKRANVPSAIPVVKIDVNGNELARYSDMSFAARCNNTNPNKIMRYCRRQQPKQKNEFEVFGGFTVRFVHEWDTMTREEQLADIASSNTTKRRQGRRFKC